jgi:hypothetical protein
MRGGKRRRKGKKGETGKEGSQTVEKEDEKAIKKRKPRTIVIKEERGRKKKDGGTGQGPFGMARTMWLTDAIRAKLRTGPGKGAAEPAGRTKPSISSGFKAEAPAPWGE